MTLVCVVIKNNNILGLLTWYEVKFIMGNYRALSMKSKTKNIKKKIQLKKYSSIPNIRMIFIAYSVFRFPFR